MNQISNSLQESNQLLINILSRFSKAVDEYCISYQDRLLISSRLFFLDFFSEGQQIILNYSKKLPCQFLSTLFDDITSQLHAIIQEKVLSYRNACKLSFSFAIIEQTTTMLANNKIEPNYPENQQEQFYFSFTQKIMNFSKLFSIIISKDNPFIYIIKRLRYRSLAACSNYLPYITSIVTLQIHDLNPQLLISLLYSFSCLSYDSSSACRCLTLLNSLSQKLTKEELSDTVILIVNNSQNILPNRKTASLDKEWDLNDSAHFALTFFNQPNIIEEKINSIPLPDLNNLSSLDNELFCLCIGVTIRNLQCCRKLSLFYERFGIDFLSLIYLKIDEASNSEIVSSKTKRPTMAPRKVKTPPKIDASDFSFNYFSQVQIFQNQTSRNIISDSDDGTIPKVDVQLITKIRFYEKALYVILPLTLFKNDREFFNNHIKDTFHRMIKISSGKYLSSVLNHLDTIEEFQSFLPNLLWATEQLRDSSQFAKNSLVRIFHAFTTKPEFLSFLIKEHIDTFRILFTLATNFGHVDAFFALQALLKDKTLALELSWSALESIISIISNLLLVSGLWTNSPFLRKIHILLLNFAQFIVLRLANYTTDTNESQLTSIFSVIELDAFLLLPSHSYLICETSISLFETLIQAVHLSGLNISVDIFQSIVNACRGRTKYTITNISLISALKIIPSHSSGSISAWNASFRYVSSAIRCIIPQLSHLLNESFILNNKVLTLEEICNEQVVNNFAFLLAVCPQESSGIFALISQFPKYESHHPVIKSICKLLPNIINPIYYPALLSSLFATIDSIPDIKGNDQSLLLQNSKNIELINCSMMIFRGLVRQPLWSNDIVGIELLTKFTNVLMKKCNISKQIALTLCTIGEKIAKDMDPLTRQRIGGTIAFWLAQSKENESLYLAALTSFMDNLELSDPTGISTIRYLVDIASKMVGSASPLIFNLCKRNSRVLLENCFGKFTISPCEERSIYLSALASSNINPSFSGLDEDIETQDKLGSLLMKNFQLYDLVAGEVSYQEAESTASILTEAAIINGVGIQYATHIVQTEVSSITVESQNTLFRGNGISPMALGHFTKLYGTKWLKNTIYDLIQDVINKTNNGKKYQIKNLQTPPEELETIRNDFKEFLKNIIIAILSNIKILPKMLIDISKMIYQIVESKFEGLGINIVNSFLFLRFVFPILSNPISIGFTDELPEEAHCCMVNASVFFMAAILNGSIKSKGKPFEPFESLAHEVHQLTKNSLFQMMGYENLIKPLETELSNAIQQKSSQIQVSEENEKSIDEQVAQTIDIEVNEINLINIFAKQINLLKTKVVDHQEIKDVINKAIRILEQKSSYQENQFTNQEQKNQNPSKGLRDLLQTDFSNENLADFKNWFFPNFNSSIFFLVNEKLPKIKNRLVIIYYIYKTLDSFFSKVDPNVPSPFSIVCTFSKFDSSVIPESNQLFAIIRGFPEYITKNLEFIYILQPCGKFCKFLSESKLNSASFLIRSIWGKLKFVLSQQDIPSYFDLSSYLPAETIETLGEPETKKLIPAIVNGTSIHIGVFRHSIIIYQFLQQMPFLSFTCRPILYSNITKVIPYSARVFGLTENSSFFKFTFKSKEDNIFRMIHHSVTLAKKESSSVVVEENLISWLEVGLSLAAILEESPQLKESGFQLLKSTIYSYGMKTSKAFPSILPKVVSRHQMANFSTKIGIDLAQNNPESATAFIAASSKILPYLSKQVSNYFIKIIAAWLPYLAFSPSAFNHLAPPLLIHLECFAFFSDKIFASYSNQNDSYVLINENPCKKEIDEESHKTSEKMILETKINPETVFKVLNDQSHDFSMAAQSLTKAAPKTASAYWSNHLDERYAVQSLNILFNSKSYDYSNLPQLVYSIIKLRDPSEETLVESLGILLFTALDADYSFKEAFENKGKEYLQWVINTAKLAKSISMYLDDRQKFNVFELFKQDLLARNYRRYSAAIFAASCLDFSQKESEYIAEIESFPKIIVDAIGIENHDMRMILFETLSLTSSINPKTLGKFILLAFLTLVIEPQNTPAFRFLSSAISKEYIFDENLVSRVENIIKLNLSSKSDLCASFWYLTTLPKNENFDFEEFENIKKDVQNTDKASLMFIDAINERKANKDNEEKRKLKQFVDFLKDHPENVQFDIIKEARVSKIFQNSFDELMEMSQLNLDNKNGLNQPTLLDKWKRKLNLTFENSPDAWNLAKSLIEI